MKELNNYSKQEKKSAFKEAKEILKDSEKGDKLVVEYNKDDILNWSIPQLRKYIMIKTTGLNPTKKLAFANELLKDIERRKKENALQKKEKEKE